MFLFARVTASSRGPCKTEDSRQPDVPELGTAESLFAYPLGRVYAGQKTPCPASSQQLPCGFQVLLCPGLADAAAVD